MSNSEKGLNKRIMKAAKYKFPSDMELRRSIMPSDTTEYITAARSNDCGMPATKTNVHINRRINIWAGILILRNRPPNVSKNCNSEYIMPRCNPERARI